MTNDEKCYYCHKPGDLRPYGPDAAWVCFPCIKSDLAHEAEASRQMSKQLDAALAASPYNSVIIGENTGPRPYNPDEDEGDFDA